MVAPTRAPQARGVKCDLCKKILSLATWLDQTKLAKEVEEAQTVLSLIKQHDTTDCPCIPKNIENLLVGSTHFEIHRLVAKHLDHQVHKRQHEACIKDRQRILVETARNKTDIINDCLDMHRTSKFKIYLGYSDQKHIEQSKQQLRHLCRAIDYWRTAMEDQTNPFNSKLALRLGLTHHVIYACYLFKYYKILDYQLVTANLLLNVFRSIEGVTPNAILHANFILIKTLIDCDRIHLARQQLRQATKSTSYAEKSHYESILLQCVACELDFLEGRDNIYSSLEELAELAVIKPDDKLQHYYARTLAMSMILKYIHCYPTKSDNCFEFFHSYRYICAIIRRCYESSFELVLAEKDTGSQQSKEAVGGNRQAQILDHSWIRYAVCDFVYATFSNLADFYMRAGMPECLELLYNGLNLVAFRNGGLFWQSKIIEIGVRLDLLCDKFDHAKEKLNILSRIVSYTDDPYFMNLLRLESEVTFLSLLDRQESSVSQDVIKNLLERVETCKLTLVDKLDQLELFDIKSDTITKMSGSQKSQSSILLSGIFNRISLMAIKLGIKSLLMTNSIDKALELTGKMETQLKDYFENQILLEISLLFASIDQSEQKLLDALRQSQVFLECDLEVSDIENQLSSLTLNSEAEKDSNGRASTSTLARSKPSKIGRKSRRKGTYNVAKRSSEVVIDRVLTNHLSVSETISNIAKLSAEELAVSYLRNSEPNPDFLLYRRAHELLLCSNLTDENQDRDSILYHFVESNPTNTMRYRWMMFEEQQISPFEPVKTNSLDGDRLLSNRVPARQLSFCNSLVNQEKTLKSMTRTLPEGYRLIQLKYILDTTNEREHLLCASLSNSNDHIFVHARRSLISDFYDDPSIPRRLALKIEESRKSLMKINQRSKSELRNGIETDIELILTDIENDWLGPFRFLFSGDICDARYNKFIDEVIADLKTTIMVDKTCRSDAMLRLMLENAPLLSRQDLCRLIAILFSCRDDSGEVRDCFNRWLKLIESFMKKHNLGSNKTALLQQLERGQLGLILDNHLELIPFEAMPFVKITSQGAFRVPSLRIFSILTTRRCLPVKIDPNEVAYMLDPANNLTKTRERFDQKLNAQTAWRGTIGKSPPREELEEWLSEKQLYLFIGHGAGTTYYNRLCRGRGLSSMAHVESAAIVMGCSSGRMQAEGPRLETFGIGWVFILRGAPCYMGLLWDVTDNDIDKYLDALLDKWMPSLKWASVTAGQRPNIPLTNASSQARHVCRLKLLVGSAPVVYGLPVWSRA